MIFTNKSTQNINKHISHDLRHSSLTVQSCRSNKISVNADKTEVIIFRSKWKQIIKHVSFRISGQRINISNKVEYLGMQIDWNVHIKNVNPKLNRAISILSKMRHNVRKFLLKTIYYSLFTIYSHLIYAYQVWG